jgi:hypothetical protein
MYYNIFFGTSHTTNRMSFNFTLNRGAFVLEILSPGAGVWDIRRPRGRHVIWATSHTRHLAIPLGEGTYLFRWAQQFCCTPQESICVALHFTRSRSRSRSRRRGLITANSWPTFAKRLRDWPSADVLGNSVGSPTCSTLYSQWLSL